MHSKYNYGNDLIPSIKRSNNNSNLWCDINRSWSNAENISWKIGMEGRYSFGMINGCLIFDYGLKLKVANNMGIHRD